MELEAEPNQQKCILSLFPSRAISFKKAHAAVKVWAFFLERVTIQHNEIQKLKCLKCRFLTSPVGR